MAEAPSLNPGMPIWLQRLAKYRGLLVPVGFILALGVILVPLPPMLMDLLISVNVSLAIVVLLTTIYMNHPLDFSVFPSLLLVLACRFGGTTNHCCLHGD